MEHLTRSEAIARLRLIRTTGIGPSTYAALLARCGSGEAALDAAPRLARRGGRSAAFTLAPTREAEDDLAAAAAIGAVILFADAPAFPHALAVLDPPPPLIYVRGNASLLARPMTAIVGARNASAAGRRIASDMARDLARAGCTVVSGFARGIDTAAHEGALDSGTAEGGTCAVFAGGADVVYPPENAALAERMAREGVIVSEIPPGVQPQAGHFPRRNRLISGLSQVVVVVEATQHSGSLITARLAGEQGREVAAVPGSPLDPRARGPNALIRDGASLVETADDVLALLNAVGPGAAEPGRTAPSPPPVLDDDAVGALRERIAGLLSPAPIALDHLIRETGASAAAVSAAVLELELGERAVRHPGQRVSSV